MTSASFLLIHGAWHGAWCWHKVVARLRAHGHRVHAIDLPSHGIDSTAPAEVTLDDYVTRIGNALDGMERPILVAHSMGGIAGSQAAERRPEAIAKLVYVAAFMLRDGACLLDVALKDTRSLATPNLVVDEPHGIVDIRRSATREVFYGACTPQDVCLAETVLKPNALRPFGTPLHLSETAYGRVPRYYVTARDDRAISLEVQQEMIAQSPCRQVFELATDHSPFLSAPDELVATLERIASE
jgi:pimeloyl-ACP methyl ester carboxylesterase